LENQIAAADPVSTCIGLVGGSLQFTNMEDVPRIFDMEKVRPKKQWWMDLQSIASVLAKPAPD
jgi:hypothetical protein